VSARMALPRSVTGLNEPVPSTRVHAACCFMRIPRPPRGRHVNGKPGSEWRKSVVGPFAAHARKASRPSEQKRDVKERHRRLKAEKVNKVRLYGEGLCREERTWCRARHLPLRSAPVSRQQMGRQAGMQRRQAQ